MKLVVWITKLGLNGGWRPDFRLAFGSHTTILTLGWFHIHIYWGNKRR